MAACGGGGDDTPAASAPPPSSPSTGGGGAANPPPAPANSAPTIQGQPAGSVRVGQSYTFQPTANDPNGDRLTFSAANLPSWLSLNASTGRISGTPAASDVGTASGITITVSDGSASATLGPFSIAVTQTQTTSGSALLTWTPPLQNTDGSSLNNLSGYRVLYGTSASNLSQTISITNPSLSSYLVENLSSGTWYFAVVAVNADGVQSAPSALASKTIS